MRGRIYDIMYYIHIVLRECYVAYERRKNSNYMHKISQVILESQLTIQDGIFSHQLK
jgi:hypothetical protein